MLELSDERFLQNSFAVDKYLGRTTRRFFSIMIQASNAKTFAEIKAIKSFSQFSQVLSFARIIHRRSTAWKILNTS